MKHQLIFVLAFVVSFWAIPDTFASKPDNSAKKDSASKIGYLVVVEQGNKFTKFKTESLVEVYSIAEMVFPQNCISFEKELSKSPYFEISNANKYLYVERKIVGKRGNLKRAKK